jgi:hypothetical protein
VRVAAVVDLGCRLGGRCGRRGVLPRGWDEAGRAGVAGGCDGGAELPELHGGRVVGDGGGLGGQVHLGAGHAVDLRQGLLDPADA